MFEKHENFNADFLLNDISLFKLSAPVPLSNYIQPACIVSSQSSSYQPTIQAAYVAGWGANFEGGPVSRQLQNVKINLYPTSYCDRVQPGMPKNWLTQICAGEINGGKDTCQGDSGGPLYVKETINGKTKYVVAGLTSFGLIFFLFDFIYFQN